MTPELLQKVLTLLEPIANNTSEDPREDARNAIATLTRELGRPLVFVQKRQTNCTGCRRADSDGSPVTCVSCIECDRGSNWAPLNPTTVNPNCNHTFVFSSKLGGQLCSLCGTPYVKSRHG